MNKMNNKQLNVEKLRELRDGLPHKSLTKIAKSLGFSRGYVTRVLAGQYYNEKIIEEALRIYKLGEKRRAEISQQVNNI